MTEAPCRANWVATARLIPELPPVTKATLFSRRPDTVSPFLQFNLDDHLDLDRNLEGKRAHPDRRTGVPSMLSVERREEVRGAIDDLGLAGERGVAVHHAKQLY